MVVQRMMVCCAKMNNEGTKLLSDGKFVQATESFMAALQLVKSSITAFNERNDITGDKRHPAQENLVSPLYHMVHDSEELSASASSLYRSPLLISTMVDYERDASFTVEASVAVIFNLAVTHHLEALSNAAATTPVSGNHASFASSMQQAATLYELAYNIQIKEDIELHAEITMAMINNLGHIYRAQGNDQKSEECFRHLLSTHFFLQSYGRTDYRTEEFLASTVYLILKNTVASAA